MNQNTKKIKVLMIEDSLVAQEMLTSIIEKDQTMEVVKRITNGTEALEFLEGYRPDVLTMDINLPGMDGYTLTKKIMETSPIPIVIISGHYSNNDLQKSFRSVEVGAVSILEKPKGPLDSEFAAKSAEIRKQIKMASFLKSESLKNNLSSTPIKPDSITSVPFHHEKCYYKGIAIGCSFGGPTALQHLLSHFDKSLPVPVFIVQHISPGFSKGMVDWLQKNTGLKVCLGENNLYAEPGTVYIAPDSKHMLVDPESKIQLDSRANGSSHQPSVGKLFESVANAFGPKGIGILLTGMGTDGSKELLFMREKGAFTIAQDEESCVIYGMPGEAIRLGAAKVVLPLEDIPEQIIRLLNPKKVEEI